MKPEALARSRSVGSNSRLAQSGQYRRSDVPSESTASRQYRGELDRLALALMQRIARSSHRAEATESPEDSLPVVDSSEVDTATGGDQPAATHA